MRAHTEKGERREKVTTIDLKTTRGEYSNGESNPLLKHLKEFSYLLNNRRTFKEVLNHQASPKEDIPGKHAHTGGRMC